MKLRDIFARIRLVLDKDAATSAEKQAQSSFQRISGAAKKLGVALGAAFVVGKIRQWGAELIRSASEADAIWNRLAGTLSTVGIEFRTVEVEVKAAARALQDVSTFGDEQFADVLGELTSISRDYAKSLQNVALVADLAAAKQIDVRTAAQLVGRAMIGETALLKRYGIIVKEGADAIETMRAQFAGMAQNEANTLSGKLTQLSNEWGDFKEELGGALLELSNGTGIIDTAVALVKSATESISTLYKLQLRIRLGAALVRRDTEAVASITGQLVELEKIAQDAANRRGGAGFLGMQPGDVARFAAELERARIEAEKAAEANKKLLEGGSLLRPGEIGLIGQERIQDTPTGVILKQLEDMPAAIQTASSAFDSMFGLITMDAQTAIDAFEGVGVALVTGGISGVKQYAQMKSKMALAQMIEQIAQAIAALANPVRAALTGSNPALHFKAAAEFAASAAAWRVLGGGGSSGGRSGSGRSGGGGFSPSAQPYGGRLARDAQVGSVHIYIDPLNPSRPAYQRNVSAARRYAEENYGAMQVNVHPASGRG